MDKKNSVSQASIQFSTPDLTQKSSEEIVGMCHGQWTQHTDGKSVMMITTNVVN